MSSFSSTPPKMLALYLSLPIITFGLGYLLGKPAKLSTKSDFTDESDDEDDQTGLDTVKPGILEPCKLVLVVRTDLGMTKGKIAAQCSHATLACYKALQQSNPTLLRHWERTGQAKITVQAKSEEELLILQAQAQSLNVCARSIQDAGRTQIEAGSTTVLGIGPAPVDLVNMVTSNQKLL
ncbi:PTH2-domain-containing protein [Wallemia mellicola CBS 633.66]|uniref:peptidyl-tRNA hydrolase n=1 Tax=Wallemia mellicola (strain ATCC MYA-4683 / CBS 633.66) TaxID=671144 RepID=I4Y732_WALMC|nr:PTH2-domain-containing protein [Wallemia mellicola CBS 633.66]EIM19774.1 PTH2-domain-containing protein [Wallemia mellicola CBS 633.66]|eukprot:XP_006960109.1 PTH2-domain-containing protein [Wallemia mellicola CBS 633.66]